MDQAVLDHIAVMPTRLERLLAIQEVCKGIDEFPKYPLIVITGDLKPVYFSRLELIDQIGQLKNQGHRYRFGSFILLEDGTYRWMVEHDICDIEIIFRLMELVQ
jgi:ATP:corrinoid adenosyltransferase